MTIMRIFAQCCVLALALYKGTHAMDQDDNSMSSVLRQSQIKHLDGSLSYPVAWAMILNDLDNASRIIQKEDTPLIKKALDTSKVFLGISPSFSLHGGEHAYMSLTNKYQTESTPRSWGDSLTHFSYSLRLDPLLHYPLMGLGFLFAYTFSAQTPECPTCTTCEAYTIAHTLYTFKEDMEKLGRMAANYKGMGMIGAQQFGLKDYKPRIN